MERSQKIFYVSSVVTVLLASIMAAVVMQSSLLATGNKELVSEAWISFGGIPTIRLMKILGLLIGLTVASSLVSCLSCFKATKSLDGSEKKRHRIQLMMGWFPLALSCVLVLFSLSEAKLARYRLMDCSGLKTIGFAMLDYLGDYDSSPPSLGALTYSIPPSRLYRCPASKSKAPETAEDIDKGMCDFLYYHPRSLESYHHPERVIIAHTKDPGELSDWVNFLFLDFHAEGVEGTSAIAIAKKNGWVFADSLTSKKSE